MSEETLRQFETNIEDLQKPFTDFREYYGRLIQFGKERDGQVLIEFEDAQKQKHLIAPRALQLDEEQFHTGLISKMSTNIMFNDWRVVGARPFEFDNDSKDPGKWYNHALEAVGENLRFQRGDFNGHLRQKS